MKLIKPIIAALIICAASCAPQGNQINLSGKWTVSLDSLATFQGITLPGTTDDAGLGEADTLKPALHLPQLQSLRRKHSFIGEAFYQRNFYVPEKLEGKPLYLTLERVIWQSAVWVDGVKLDGEEESLTTPHHYMIPEGLKKGRHTIMLRIDNRKRYDISRNELAHAYTNDTQIKWNGVLGKIAFDVFENPVEVRRIDVYPHADTRTAEVRITLYRSDPSVDLATVRLYSDCGPEKSMTVGLTGTVTEFITPYDFEDNAGLWDEFNPILHKMTAECGKSKLSADFGIRDIKTEGTGIYVNGRKVFLRGTLDCCIFPLTGTPPTDEAGWEKTIGTCKEWGLNHIRFHSYCPPDAAFRVADRMGFYLQVELPIWSSATVYENVQKFLMSETDRILENYGNHPSFCMLSGGNELDRGYEYLNGWLRYIKAKDARHIYTNATYSMGAGHKGYPEPEDQYMSASRTYLGQIRGQDYIGSQVPDFRSDYSKTAIDLGLPLISHEIGQYSVYPAVSEISKYTGVLSPLNFISVRDDLEQKGLLDKAEDYTMASGRLGAILYKEEVERALKTSGLSGFQLLGLQDFPGQCTALVGLVDSFWDNKGLVTEEWFRQACAPVTPLTRYEKACWTSSETFKSSMEFANYWKKDIDGEAEWSLSCGDRVLASGKAPASLPTGYTTALKDSIYVDLSSVEDAAELTLKLSLGEWSNSWNIWVYPEVSEIQTGSVTLARTLDDALPVLEKGGKVLLSPDPSLLNGEKGKFVPVFWSPVFFPQEAGTMGLLCDPSHPALSRFPTEMHSNWQWWTLTRNSSALNLDSMPQIGSIIDAVDNFVRNRRLSYIFEAEYGKGKILFSTMDLLGDGVSSNPEVCQLLRSLVDYMNSDKFAPTGVMSESELMKCMEPKPKPRFPMIPYTHE